MAASAIGIDAFCSKAASRPSETRRSGFGSLLLLLWEDSLDRTSTSTALPIHRLLTPAPALGRIHAKRDGWPEAP